MSNQSNVGNRKKPKNEDTRPRKKYRCGCGGHSMSDGTKWDRSLRRWILGPRYILSDRILELFRRKKKALRLAIRSKRRKRKWMKKQRKI